MKTDGFRIFRKSTGMTGSSPTDTFNNLEYDITNNFGTVELSAEFQFEMYNELLLY